MHAMKDQNLSPAQVVQLTRAMFSVAGVDGIHPAEAALISQFHEASRSVTMPSAEAVMASPEARQFDPAELAGSSADFADTVVLMCLMTAYADGHFSNAERDHVKSIANVLQMDAARFETHLAQVRDDLVGALSHLPDAGSVAVVVRELSSAD